MKNVTHIRCSDGYVYCGEGQPFMAVSIKVGSKSPLDSLIDAMDEHEIMCFECRRLFCVYTKNLHETSASGEVSKDGPPEPEPNLPERTDRRREPFFMIERPDSLRRPVYLASLGIVQDRVWNPSLMLALKFRDRATAESIYKELMLEVGSVEEHMFVS